MTAEPITSSQEPTEYSLPDWVKAGVSYRYEFKKPNNINHGRTFEVRGIVDGLVVVREWSDRKGWAYTVESPSLFEVFGTRIVPVVEKRKS
jgi:hypothetical protein